MTTIYVAGYNMAGYMPDSEPAEFDSFDDAKRYVIDVLKTFEDEAYVEAHAEDYCAAAEDANLENRPFSYMVRGWAFWVTEA